MAGQSSKSLEVWIVEDNQEYRAALVDVIDSAPDMMCSCNFASCEEAIAALHEEPPPQFILLDIGLPGMSGIEGIPLLKSASPATDIIMLTVYEDNDRIFQSICAGASGYLLKR